MKCGNCGANIDNHTYFVGKRAETAEPKDGDVSICLFCGEICRFVNGELVLIDVKDLPEDVQDVVLGLDIIRRKVLRP